MRAVRKKRRSDGFMLLGLFTAIMIMGMMSGLAVQEWSVIERREREAQLIFIQEQFAAAVLNYQQDQNALPVDLEALTKKGQKGQVFLRKEWTDPITRAKTMEEWCLLKIGGAGRVVSTCAAEGAAENDPFAAGGAAGSGGGAGTGLNRDGTSNAGLGSNFKVGQETGAPRDRNVNGIAPGGVGLVGVHSKSTLQAFNTLKRQDETYDRWYYTVEDYKKEITARSIPGLPQGKGPAESNQFGNSFTQQNQGNGRPGQNRPRGGAGNGN